MAETEWNDVLVGMLILSSRQLERDQRRARRYFAGLTVFAVLTYIATWLYAADTLWATRQLGDGSQFWDAYKYHVSIAALLGSFHGLISVLMGAIDQALAMRRAIEAADATIAPIAPEQPLPLLVDELWKGPVQLVSLVRPERASARRQRINPGVSFFVIGAVCAGLAALFLALAGELMLGPWLAVIVLVFFAMTLLCVAMGVLMMLQARRSLSPLNLTADEWGLAWDSARVLRRQMHIAWHEAKAFFCAVPNPLVGTHARRIYVLDGGDAVLAWALPSHALPAERAASERLGQLIVTRTRLPLRSITFDPLHPMPAATERARERKPLDSATVPAAPVSAWRSRMRHPSCLGVLAVLALTGSLGALGWILDQLRP